MMPTVLTRTMLLHYLRNIQHVAESNFVSTAAKEGHIKSLAYYASAEQPLTMKGKIMDISS
jgi:hypothetical protein